MALEIPATREDITPPWLGAALREAGIAAEIRSVAITDGSAGRGFASQLLRATPEYASPAQGAPRSLIAKIALDLPDMPIEPAPWAAEIDWYLHRSPACPIRVPRCYWAKMDPAAGRFCILLEDLGDLTIVTQAEGASRGQALSAVNAMARLHATHWGAAETGGIGSAIDPRPRAASLGDAVLRGWDAFIELYGDLLTDEFRASRDSLAAAIPTIASNLERTSPTVVHGDYKLDNLLFGEPGGADEVVVLDWQGMRAGSAAEEFAGFLQASLTVETRRLTESELLSRYARVLAGQGVPAYDGRQLRQDYRLGLLTAIAGPIGGCEQVLSGGWAGGDAERDRRIREYSRITFERRIASIVDTRALDLL
jgi:aminoglycoside/choline kinase family phosphotransferase